MADGRRSSTARGFFLPEIIVYQNANAPGREAWLSPWEDEDVWPEATLQQLQLDQAISAVWESNLPPFVELFIFDGPDLQGSLMRIVRVQTAVPPLELVLTAQSDPRSLVGSVRSIPGRRFSAEQELGVAVSLKFAQWLSQSGVNQFGTASLVEPPHFSWDGYDMWLSSGSQFPPLPKTAALRIRLVIRIDDVLYGTTTASGVFDTILQRTGGANPVAWVEDQTTGYVPDPWAGNVSAGNPRWAFYFIDVLSTELSDVVAQQIGLLAGASPGSVRILPGRSTRVPTPPAPIGV